MQMTIRIPRTLESKLTAPSSAPQQIVRAALVDQIACTGNAKLVLVRAQAGFGKTTLMLQCQERFQRMSIATAWLTLDRSDNDASRLLAGLDAAASLITEENSTAAQNWLGESDLNVGGMALQIISRLSGFNAPFALFIDDFETIQEPGILSLLRELIDHLPPHGRLVIGSRSLPDLRLGRMRARGQLLEVDAASLRFTLDETREFLTAKRNIRLGSGDISRLQDKTEGWVAAIWLASVALERSTDAAAFIKRLSGSERSIANYLAEEILSHQPADVRRFLLRTSVLRHLEAPLCDALVPGTDSRAILDQLEMADVLLTPVGTVRDGFRYHSLFADFLQSELTREKPAELASLHAEAAAWYETQGRPVPAIDHLLEGGHIARAVALMSVHCPELLAQGRMRLLSRWFPTIPETALHRYPELQLIQMWAVCFTHGSHQAMELLARSGLKDSDDPRIMAHVRALEPCLLAIMDRYEDAYAIGYENIEYRSGLVPFADDVLSNAMAHIVSVIDNHERARRLIDKVRSSQGTHASEFNRMYSEASDGFIDLQEAMLRQAIARFRIAVTAPHGEGYTHTNGNAWAGVPYAAALYESGQIDLAAHLLQVYAPLARDVGLPDLVILGNVTLSRIGFSRGDVDQALQLLTELEYIGHKNRLPRVVCSAKLERARIFLLQGHSRAARDELDHAEDDSVWDRVERMRYLANDLDYLALGRMRWQLHAGNPADAAVRLSQAAMKARSDSRHRRALKLELLRAAALFRAGDTVQALTALGQVLRAAGSEGFLRLVLDEGDIMRPPIHALAAAHHAEQLRDEPMFADYVQRLAQALGPIIPAAPAADGLGQAILLEPLTRKEINVLQLLAEGYSNSAMAEKLFVSDSTIRTHLRNINTKLDAHNRTHAVATARRLNIIA